MRGFVALVRREVRDLRWHFRTAFFLGAATPWAVHGLLIGGSSADTHAAAGGRVIVPLMFALFVAATASDLVSREVATRRIDALAALPVPICVVWRAKVAVLLASSAAFLLWAVGAEWLTIELTRTTNGSMRLAAELAEAVPSLLFGLAFGMAALFFSTLLERGMSAALAAIVAMVFVAAGVEFAHMPAARDAFTAFATHAVPIALSVAFAAASYRALVRGPVHGPSKLRVATHGFVTLGVLVGSSGAALAFGLGAACDLEPGAGDPARRQAYLSPDERWVAVGENVDGGVSRTWLVGVDDGSCRAITAGPSRLVGGAWLPGNVLTVTTSTFSVIAGACSVHALEVEPTRLGVMEDRWIRRPDGISRGSETPRGAVTLRDGRRLVLDGDVTLTAADGARIRRLFPPSKED